MVAQRDDDVPGAAVPGGAMLTARGARRWLATASARLRSSGAPPPAVLVDRAHDVSAARASAVGAGGGAAAAGAAGPTPARRAAAAGAARCAGAGSAGAGSASVAPARHGVSSWAGAGRRRPRRRDRADLADSHARPALTRRWRAPHAPAFHDGQ
jgi:hypothetical protein